MAKLEGLTNEWKGIEYPLSEPETTVGRVEGNHLQVVDPTISSRHAAIRLVDGGWELEDLGSTNGTQHNDQPISKVALVDGDTISFGGVPFLFHAEQGGASAPPASRGNVERDQAIKPSPQVPTGDTRVVSGIDLHTEAEGEPPESFGSTSPFSSGKRSGLNLWGIILGLAVLIALGLVGYVLYKLLGTTTP